MPAKKGHKKVGGRKKGTPNKTSALLKDAILQAGTNAGGPDGLIGYLQTQAIQNPNGYMSLLGKIIPLTLGNDPDNPITAVSKEQIDAANAAFLRSKL